MYLPADQGCVGAGDQKAVAADFLHDRVHARNATWSGVPTRPSYAAGDLLQSELAQGLAAAPLAEGIKRALFTIGRQLAATPCRDQTLRSRYR